MSLMNLVKRRERQLFSVILITCYNQTFIDLFFSEDVCHLSIFKARLRDIILIILINVSLCFKFDFSLYRENTQIDTSKETNDEIKTNMNLLSNSQYFFFLTCYFQAAQFDIYKKVELVFLYI